MKTEIIEINGELGIALPEEIVARLNLDTDSYVYLIENANSITISVDENAKNTK